MHIQFLFFFFFYQLRNNKNALDESSEEIGVGLVDGKIDLPQFISVKICFFYL